MSIHAVSAEWFGGSSPADDNRGLIVSALMEFTQRYQTNFYRVGLGVGIVTCFCLPGKVVTAA